MSLFVFPLVCPVSRSLGMDKEESRINPASVGSETSVTTDTSRAMQNEALGQPPSHCKSNLLFPTSLLIIIDFVCCNGWCDSGFWIHIFIKFKRWLLCSDLFKIIFNFLVLFYQNCCVWLFVALWLLISNSFLSHFDYLLDIYWLRRTVCTGLVVMVSGF